jgi:hypothetical protein
MLLKAFACCGPERRLPSKRPGNHLNERFNPPKGLTRAQKMQPEYRSEIFDSHTG